MDSEAFLGSVGPDGPAVDSAVYSGKGAGARRELAEGEQMVVSADTMVHTQMSSARAQSGHVGLAVAGRVVLVASHFELEDTAMSQAWEAAAIPGRSPVNWRSRSATGGSAEVLEADMYHARQKRYRGVSIVDSSAGSSAMAAERTAEVQDGSQAVERTRDVEEVPDVDWGGTEGGGSGTCPFGISAKL